MAAMARSTRSSMASPARRPRSQRCAADIMCRAEADDGLLDGAMMHHGGPWPLLVDGIRLLRKRHDRSPNIDYVKIRSVAVDTPGLRVQIDGEPYGQTPMRFEI